MNLLWALFLTSSAASLQNLEFWTDRALTGNYEVRITAMQKLADLKDFSSIPVLGKLLQSEDAEIRFHAARALGKFPTEEAFKPLQAQAVAEKDVYVKSEINRSMNTLKDFIKRTEGSKPSTPAPEEEILE